MKELLAAVDGAAVQAAFDTDGRYVLDVDGDPIPLTADEVQIRALVARGARTRAGGRLAVALDTTLDDALRREGLAREVVRAINDQRKAQGFEIADRIRVALDADGDARGRDRRAPRLDRAARCSPCELDLGIGGRRRRRQLTIDGGRCGSPGSTAGAAGA